MTRKIFKEGKKYTFNDYFEMENPTEEIVAELGYSFSTQALTLALSTEIDQEWIDNLRASYYLIIPKISINSEIAKRELMIAPILHGVIRNVEARLNIEYPIEIDDRLSGYIDYLFRSKQELIVIEAKKGDLEKGFNQLAAEMIAVDHYEDNPIPNILYGAISIGEVWRFAILERETQKITKDIHTFRFPEDLDNIVAILTGILS